MSKKDFIARGVESLLSGTQSKPKAAGKKTQESTAPTAKSTTGETKAATFNYRLDHLKKLKAVSYFDERLMQDIVAEALEDFFTKYEKANGKIKTR